MTPVHSRATGVSADTYGEAMRISELPAPERPRERLAAHGPGVLAGRELLAVLLGTGARGVGAYRCTSGSPPKCPT